MYRRNKQTGSLALSPEAFPEVALVQKSLQSSKVARRMEQPASTSLKLRETNAVSSPNLRVDHSSLQNISRQNLNSTSHNANNVNAQNTLNRKMRALQGAQKEAVRVQEFSDGRIRYYERERLSKTPGPTRGAAHVTEYHTKTGQVRAWSECYDHQGNVNRIRPKMIDGQVVRAQHYPPIKAELEAWTQKPKGRK